MKSALLLAFAVACVDPSATPTESVSDIDQAATVCGVGPTVKGIDVSVYQGAINWTQVAADGVKFAVIRVSDGLNSPDSKFATNWAGSRAAGVLHGAYQFFRPSQDATAQADLLLSKTGPLQADDLPPVLDVEANDGLGAAAVAAGVKTWVDHVTAKIGRPPIIYTGFYFWRDSVGGADETASPLWHAQYTTAACPNIADPWTNWAMWQYTSTGSVSGISGNVDTDRWNGDMASLTTFLGPAGTCGDGTCNPGEDKFGCPEDCGYCGTIDAAGGDIDDGDACFISGGPQAGMRLVSTAGDQGDLEWTHTTAAAAEENFGEWSFNFAEAGHYKVEAYTAAAFAQSKQAKYIVHAAGMDQTVTIDQSAVDGWQSLGEFDFAAGAHQSVHLGDNTGEDVANNVQLVFDGVRVTRLDNGSGSGGSGSGSDMGSGSGSDMIGAGKGGGCSTSGGGAGLGILLAFLGLRRRRQG